MLELTIESVLKSRVSTYFLGFSPSMVTNPARICWLSGMRFPPSVSSTFVQLPSVSAPTNASARARIDRRRGLLNRFIESVVIIEKVLGLGVLVFEQGFSAFADLVEHAFVDVGRCRDHTVGIVHNETAEIFV